MTKSISLAFIVVLTPFYTLAQFTNCDLNLPTISCPSDTRICIDETSGTMTVSNPSGLSAVEYAVIDVNLQSTAQTGPTVLGFTNSPSFKASDFGITSATTVEFLAVAYDLPTVQIIIEGLLNGQSQGTPCCDVVPLFSSLCTGLMNVGVNMGSDFVSLNQMLTTLNPDGDLLSVSDIVLALESLNFVFSDVQIFPAECGGGNTICYAYSAACSFDIIQPTAQINFTSADHNQSTSAFASKIISTATVKSNQTVDYFYRAAVELKDDFSTEKAGVFTVAKKGCD